MRGWKWGLWLVVNALAAMLVMRGHGPVWVDTVAAVCVQLGVLGALFALVYAAGRQALKLLRGVFCTGGADGESSAALYILDLAQTALKWFLIGVFALSVLSAFGVSIGPMLCGLGLAALPITLGAQNIFKNLIGGVLFVFGRRAAVGDRILVGGCDGVLEQVGAQGLLLRQKDGALAYVPFEQVGVVVNHNSTYTVAQVDWVFPANFSLERMQELVDNAFSDLKKSGAQAAYGAGIPVMRIASVTQEGAAAVISVRTSPDPEHAFDALVRAALLRQLCPSE